GSGAPLAFQAQELLRRELEGLIPRGLAERLVPGRRGRDPVPNVQVYALQQRQVAHRLSHRARRARRLRVLALPLDGLPWPAPAIRTAAAAPDPARSEEHTSELQSHLNLVCRLLLEKKKSI